MGHRPLTDQVPRLTTGPQGLNESTGGALGQRGDLRTLASMSVALFEGCLRLDA